MNQSLWKETVSLPQFPCLEGTHNTDVLIIGGGITGILCAHFLKESGVPYILVEGDRIASGITKNTTAKITSQHGLIYHKLIKDFGKEKALMYLTANQNALREYERLAKNIDCDFERKDVYTYSLKERELIEKEVEAVNSLGFHASFREHPGLPFETKGAICFPHQAQFHPLKFLKEIVKDLNIYENTQIRDITPTSARSENAQIRAKKIIVATHFPFINKHGSYFLKLYQHRSYVLALKDAPPTDGMYVDEDEKGLSFRSYGKYLLLGGGGHRTGKTGGSFGELHDFAKRHYPDASITGQWATQDTMSLDSVPYIGEYSKRTPDLYVASGFNKWGMTSSMVAASILCDMVKEEKNDYAQVFSPSRSIIKPQLFVNAFESTVNLLTPTVPRCPHLGCALKWNKAEHTWDCPCHGSRFTKEGKLLDNPATDDASF